VERRNNSCKKLSPLDPHAFFFDAFFILIHLLKRDYESAVAVARAVTEMNPSFSATYEPYLSALGHLGRMHFIASSPLERGSDRDHYAQGLRLAGVPGNVAGTAELMQDPPAHIAV
jgi:hypothetical protein